jgi:hypothetical protein
VNQTFSHTMEDGFIPLNNDSGCRRMQSIALQYDRVHLYAVHLMSQPDVVALDPLIEYPCMAPPVPPVVNETNEGPTDVGPTAEDKNAESGVSGPNCGVNEDGPELDLNDLGPMLDENDLFGEHENRPEGVNEDGLGNEDGQGNEGVVEDGVDNEDGLGNVTPEREDSALGQHFGDSDDEVCIAGNLDTEVGGNVVNKPTATLNEDPVFNDPTVNVETVVGEGSGVNEATVVGEGSGVNEATVNVGEGSGVNEDNGNEATVQAETVTPRFPNLKISFKIRVFNS